MLPVLKKNYTKLCDCLPQDCTKMVDKLKQKALDVSAYYLDQLRMLPCSEFNKAIVGGIMHATLWADDDVFLFCDVMESLCDEITLRNFIETLRKGKFTTDRRH